MPKTCALFLAALLSATASIARADSDALAYRPGEQARSLLARDEVDTRHGHGVSMMGNGIALVTVGTLLSIAAAIPHYVDTHQKYGCSSDCQLPGDLTAASLGGVAAAHMLVGIPLLVGGVNRLKTTRHLAIEGVGPRVLNGGGGLGMSGRF